MSVRTYPRGTFGGRRAAKDSRGKPSSSIRFLAVLANPDLLRDKGILTPEEFDAAKQRVLSS